MNKNIKFTLSMSPFLDAKHVRHPDNLKILHSVAPHVHDINFTTRAMPFDTDAHGVAVDAMQAHMHLKDMLYVQEQTGIRISALFNNIYVPPTHDKLREFVASFRPFYEMGVRSATIPHTLWLKWNLIQREFPELTIKQTVLRRLHNAQDFWNYAEAGFDYVNIDRLLARNRPELKRIRRAQKRFEDEYGKRVLLSLLLSEGCVGACPFWEEHYQHTMLSPDAQRFERSEDTFRTPQLISCKRKSAYFNSTTLTPFREDFEELTEYIDVIKIPGRRWGAEAFYGNLDVVLDILFGSTPLVAGLHISWVSNLLEGYIQGQLPSPLRKGLDAWRQAIKNCQFQCWECDLCNRVSMEVYNNCERLQRAGLAVPEQQ